eukprot:222260_1
MQTNFPKNINQNNIYTNHIKKLSTKKLNFSLLHKIILPSPKKHNRMQNHKHNNKAPNKNREPGNIENKNEDVDIKSNANNDSDKPQIAPPIFAQLQKQQDKSINDLNNVLSFSNEEINQERMRQLYKQYNHIIQMKAATATDNMNEINHNIIQINIQSKHASDKLTKALTILIDEASIQAANILEIKYNLEQLRKESIKISE